MIITLLFNTIIVFGPTIIYDLDFEHTSRFASLIHSIISLISSVLFLLNGLSIDIFRHIVVYNIIYILTDIFLYLTNRISNKDIKEMIIHHVCFLIASLGSLYIWNFEYYSYAIMSEGSTIFLNTKWFAINNIYFKNVRLHRLLFAISFFIFRIINMTYLMYILGNSIYYYFIIPQMPIVILNYIWFYNLYKKLIKS